MKEHNTYVHNFVLEIKQIEIWKHIYGQKLKLFYLKKIIQEELKKKRKQNLQRKESLEKKLEDKRKSGKKKNTGNTHCEKNKNCSSNNTIHNTNKSKNKFSIFFNNPLAYDNYFTSKKQEDEEKTHNLNMSKEKEKEHKKTPYNMLLNKTYPSSKFKNRLQDSSKEKESFSTTNKESIREKEPTTMDLSSIIHYQDYGINDSFPIHGKNLFNKNKNRKKNEEYPTYKSMRLENNHEEEEECINQKGSNEYQDFEISTKIQEEQNVNVQKNRNVFFKNKKKEECESRQEQVKHEKRLVTHSSFHKQEPVFTMNLEKAEEKNLEKEKEEVSRIEQENVKGNHDDNNKEKRERKFRLFVNNESINNEPFKNYMNGYEVKALFLSLTLEEKKAYYYEQNKKINSMIENEVMYGIPDCVRGFSWQALMETYAYKEKLEIKDYKYYLNISNKYENTIKKDINRTYPKHILFKNNYEKGQRILFNVLKAYSNYNSELGYCQGMAFIVAIFILYMNEEDAFFMLISVLDKYKLNDLFSSNMPLLNEYLFIFDQLLLFFFPKIHEHLQNENVYTSMYASQWFITLFSYNINILYAIRIWDFFFLYNYTFLFKIALAFFKLQEEVILKESFEDILNRLKVLSKHVELNHLIKTAVEINISQELLDRLSNNYKMQSIQSGI